MPERDQIEPLVAWRDRVPVSRLYGDPFYSLEDGLAEARHTFLRGNGLPERFRPGFHVAELGFGTGLNALAAWSAWRKAGIEGPLRFTSFEAHPIAPGDMETALSAFPDLAAEASALAACWRDGAREIRLEGLHLRVIEGDATRTLPAWTGMADAWFLDGFAPARNPALWSDAILREVARRTRPGGTAATYTAAGHVRRALAASGFTVERVPGFGRKRHMTRARVGSATA